MPAKPASKAYLDSLYERRPISICVAWISGQESRHMDWVSRILARGIETGRGGWYSKKTGYAMGPGAPETTSYIEEYTKTKSMYIHNNTPFKLLVLGGILFYLIGTLIATYK